MNLKFFGLLNKEEYTVFMAEYHYCKHSESKIETEGELPQTGVLTGKYGYIHFHKCADGISIAESSLPGSGFVPFPVSSNVFVPDYINGIPVTELHQSIILGSTLPVAIEGRCLKRVYLNVEKETPQERMRNFEGNPMGALLSVLLQEQSLTLQKEECIELEVIVGCGTLEEIEICCDQKCVLHPVSARMVRVNAPCVEIKGSWRYAENIAFSGNVYPHVTCEWLDEYANVACFAGLSKLRTIQGTLKGKYFWVFKGCCSLEKIHLANGPEKMPGYALQGCESLHDLYIPDTVTELGEYGLDGCKTLKTIHLPAKIYGIPKGMFRGCASIQKIYLSDAIMNIDDEAFSGCISLKNPWMPKNLERIGKMAFAGCSAITDVTIPESVAEIGKDAFKGCSQLQIKGFRGSAAEKYAQENGILFTSL